MIQEWILPHDRIFLFIAIVFGLADVFYLVLHKILARNRLVIIFGWLLFAVAVVVIDKNSDKPEPNPYPHFAISIVQNERTDEGNVALTNNFLNALPSEHFLPGTIFFPITNQFNFILKLSVQNLGPVLSEHAKIVIFIPEEFSCVPDIGWQRNLHTIGLDSWIFQISDLLPGESFLLPNLSFPRLPTKPQIGNWNKPSSILMRAKDSPSYLLVFNMSFALVSSNASTVPVIVPSRLINGNAVTLIPIEILKNLKQ